MGKILISKGACQEKNNKLKDNWQLIISIVLVIIVALILFYPYLKVWLKSHKADGIKPGELPSVIKTEGGHYYPQFEVKINGKNFPFEDIENESNKYYIEFPAGTVRVIFPDMDDLWLTDEKDITNIGTLAPMLMIFYR